MSKFKFQWMLVAASALVAFGCTGKDGDTGDSGTDTDDTDTDEDTDTDDTDTDDAGEPNPYTSYEGWESYDYAHPYYGGGAAGDYNWQLVWWTTGTAVETLCNSCEFVFDVYGTYDGDVSSDDDGLAAKYGFDTDFEYTYAYTDDYYGYGGAALFEYYGTYYMFAYADFDGGTFNYVSGYKDYYYDGSYGYYPATYIGYHTNYTYGVADVD